MVFSTRRKLELRGNKREMQVELRYYGSGHTYVDVSLTSGIGSSEYSLI